MIAYFNFKKNRPTSLAKYHLRQSLGLTFLVIITNIITAIPIYYNDFYIVIWILNNFGLMILWIAGIISAFYGVRLPLPLIGNFFEHRFRFIR